jgi:transcriptional regulator GlxA family with amidase domain
MKLAYILFNDITWLDLIGIYDAVSRLKNRGYLPTLEWDICAFTEPVSDQNGLTMLPTKTGGSLENYDAIIVPGGIGTRTLQYDHDFIVWLRTASNNAWKISVCTGSLLLGAAGFLKDKKATTHFLEYETLRSYCREVVTDRIVEDGNIITAGAVTASIDLGLLLCNKWGGPEAAADIRRRMDYRG